MKTKKIILGILAGIILSFIVYMAFVFGNAEFNISLWSEDSRAMCSIVMLGAFGLAFALVNN